MSGPNAGQFFEVTIPAGGAVILNVGDWANGNVIQVLTSEGGAAAFGSTAVLGDSSIDEVDTVIPSDDVIVGDGLATGADGVAEVLNIATASEAATAKAGDDTIDGGGGDNILVGDARSEEHTSELQSLMRISYAVFCLKKKK